MSFCRRQTRSSGSSDRQQQRRIRQFIEKRLQTAEDPHQLGEGYTRPLKGYWKYRLGDYRLVCEIKDQAQAILVVAIGDRKDIYR